MGQAPLPPLQTTPPTPEEITVAVRDQNAFAITQLVAQDAEVVPLVVKSLLDVHDPKKVCSWLKAGFDLKIAEMRDQHAKLQSELSQKVEEGKMQQSEMLMRISNSDGRIRSMQWFLSNIS